MALIGCIVALWWAPISLAEECLWQASTGDWSVASNWNPWLPGALDTAIIDNDGVVEITSDIGPVEKAEVAQAHEGVVVHTSGTASFYVLDLATLPGSTSAYQLSGTARIATSYLNVARGGTAQFTQTGGIVQAYENVNAGWDAGSYGTIDVSGNALLTARQSAIGTWGTGEFTQRGGMVELNGYLILGWGDTGDGTYILEAGQLTMLEGTGYNNVEVGTNGTGRFVQLGGTHTVNGNFLIGKKAGAKGVYECHNGTLHADRTWVGQYGVGELIVFGSDPLISFGKYKQGAGGRLTAVIEAGGISTIVVSGEAHLDGSWVVEDIGAPLGRFDILRAGQGISSNFSSVLLPGVDWSWGIESGNTLWVEHIPLSVEIDIKPGSDPNPINLRSRGVVPVAILTTAAFDATTVDPETVELAGASVATRGKGNRRVANEEDVDDDGDLDLVVHVETQDLDLQPEATTAVLTGETYDGTEIEGSDSIVIVPK